MKKLYTLSVFFIAGINVIAQSPNYLWAKSAGGTDYDYAYSVALDASGNIYVAGSFSSISIIFGSTTLTNDTTDATADMFLVKYDAGGNILWAKSAGGNSYDEAYSVAADVSGNVYVAGYFSSPTISFSSTTLTNPGMFFVKYDASGNVLWARNANSGFGKAASTTTDASGNIYVTGSFGTSITFDSITLTNANINTNIFLVKYDASGNVVWAKSAGGNGLDRAFSITTDTSGNILMAGDFYSDSISFGSDTLNSTWGDMFLVKYDAAGNVLWAKQQDAGGSEHDYAYSVVADAFGNIYVTGGFESPSISFGSTTLTNYSSGLGDMFLAKYDAGGNALWAKSAGGNSYDQAYSVEVDASGNIYVAGGFSSDSISFGNDTLIGDGSSDSFLVKYGATGNVLWSKSVGGSFIDYATSVTADASGNIYMAGVFYSDSISFGSDTLINASGSDMFIAKLDGLVIGIEDFQNYSMLRVYPNPTNGIFTIQSSERISVIKIVNIFGEKIHSSKLNTNKTEIDLSKQPKGIYFYQIISENKNNATGKLIIQ